MKNWQVICQRLNQGGRGWRALPETLGFPSLRSSSRGYPTLKTSVNNPRDIRAVWRRHPTRLVGTTDRGGRWSSVGIGSPPENIEIPGPVRMTKRDRAGSVGDRGHPSATGPVSSVSINECCTFRNQSGYNLGGPPDSPPAPIARPNETHFSFANEGHVRPCQHLSLIADVFLAVPAQMAK